MLPGSCRTIRTGGGILFSDRMRRAAAAASGSRALTRKQMQRLHTESVHGARTQIPELGNSLMLTAVFLSGGLNRQASALP